MITHFYIDNFKSLVNFELDLAKFTCLIGLNGAGKSTVLQALDFASALMTGDVGKWLEHREWNSDDLCSNLTNRYDIKIGLHARIDGMLYEWRAIFNVEKRYCTRESLYLCSNPQEVTDSLDQADDLFLLCSVLNDRFYFNKYLDKVIKSEEIYSEKLFPQTLLSQYEGSILAHIKPEIVNAEVIKFKEHIVSLKSLDLLSPVTLRRQSRKGNAEDIGMGGERLAAFIYHLEDADHKILERQLQAYYPQVSAIEFIMRPTDMVQLRIVETYTENGQPQETRTEARHVNDGMLRMLAILAQQFSTLETLLFDEIENGINPEVIEKVVDALVASPKQIIVTTHSPMLLNYMTDEVAKQSVMLIYKTKEGTTHATRFFDAPTAARKLKSLAPGDAMLDVYLEKIAQEAESDHAA